MSNLHVRQQRIWQLHVVPRRVLMVIGLVVVALALAVTISASGVAETHAPLPSPVATVLPPHAIIANDPSIMAAVATDTAHGNTAPRSDDAPGVPAIPVAAGASGVGQAALEQYIRGRLSLLRDTAGAEPTIVSIARMTAGGAGTHLDSAILRPDDEWVWVVRLAGEFAVDGAPLPWGGPVVSTYATSIEVYSAASGNLLLLTWADAYEPTQA